MTTYTHRFLCIPAAHRAVALALARQIADTASPGAADGMWSTGASATGAAPATHWVSSGLIEAQFAWLLGNAQATFDAFTQAGGTGVTLAQVQAMYAAATIRVDCEPPGAAHVALAAAGLQLVAQAL